MQESPDQCERFDRRDLARSDSLDRQVHSDFYCNLDAKNVEDEINATAF